VSTPQLRPLGLGEMLDVSLKIAWRNAGTLVRIVLFVVLPAQALSALIQVSASPDLYDPSGFGGVDESATVSESDVWTFAAGFAVAGLVGFIAGQLATGASFKAIAQAYLGERTTWKESLGFALRRFHSILWIVVLSGIVIVVGFVFCVLPGVWLGVAFAVALPALMTEGLRGRKALGRSFRLVRGRWWRTAVFLFVALVLTSIIGGIIQVSVAALAFASPDNPFVLFAVGTVSATAAALVTTPFSAAYHTVLYFDLRVRKEAFDLQLLAQSLGVEPPEGWVPVYEPEPGYPPGDEPPYWPPPPGWQPRSSSGSE
jgi:glycerophosphoryl diester phosphodiesterase family protein